MRRLVVVFCLLGLALAGALPAAAREGISVVSTSQETRFPQEIVFRLAARSPSPITAIRLTYLLGRAKSSAYGYPEFTPGQDVQASFSLKTSGSKYIPPGARIRFSYGIEDQAGNKLKTLEQEYVYEDTRFKWEKLTDGLVSVYYHDALKPAAETILTVSVSTLERMSKQAGTTPTDPLKVMVYSSKQEIDGALPFVSESTTRELVTLGEAHSDYDLVLMIGAGPVGNIEETAAHELMHLITHQATDNPFADFPIWLNEGLSVYAEGDIGSDNAYVRSLNAAIQDNRVPPLRWIASRPGKPDEVIQFYGQSYSVTRFMIDKYGPDKMKALLGSFKAGDTLESGLQKAYGLTLDELDNAWRASVGLSAVPTAASGEATPTKPRAVPTLVPLGSRPQSSSAPAPTAAPAAATVAPATQPTPAAEGQSALTVAIWAAAALLLVGLGGLAWSRRRS